MRLTRRSLLRTGAAALAAPAVALDGLARSPAALAQAAAPERAWKHGLSLFGDLKYPADFKQFDYVNANAPKGGAARLMAFGTFDNFNMVVAGVKGSLVAGIDLIYDTLMVAALDEVSTEYGLLAEAVSHPEDFSSVTYRLRANAKWHDGKPVTVEDVIFSFDAFKTNHPQLLGLLQPRHEGGEDRRARGHVHLRRPRQSRTAADRRPAQRAAQALVGRHRQGRQQARRRRDHARAAARLRRLSAEGVRARPHHRVRARRRLLGQGRQRQHRPR